MDIKTLLAGIPAQDQDRIIELAAALAAAERREAAAGGFLPFVRHCWPGFIEGRHFKLMGEAFDRIAEGTLKRLIICMPPRHGKSQAASIYLPAYYLGRHPHRKIIQATHTAELSVRFGRMVRNLVATPQYQELFPGTRLVADNKAAGRWDTSRGGEYFAIGTNGNVAGRGSDLFIIDDPHSEQDVVQGEFSTDGWNKTFDWFMSGPRQRLQPGGAIVILMTRYHKLDLVGQVLRSDSASKWEVIEFPAIMPSGNLLWPEFWKKDEIEALKAELPPARWAAQYMQSPTSEAGSIIKRDWWRRWEHQKPPKVDGILMSWDTAHTKSDTANYSACTVWGTFETGSDEDTKTNVILLDAFRGRWSFPELKSIAVKAYRKWQPDMMLVEAKASGQPLIYELRQMGIPVSDYTPTRGEDKIMRANAVADMFRSGVVWATHHNFAQEVIDECHEFPRGEYDDYVDTVTQALMRYRRGGIIRTEHDEPFTAPQRLYRPPVEYY